MKIDGSTKNFRVSKMFGFFGLNRVEINEAIGGDLIALSGMDDIFVGETVSSSTDPIAMPLLHVDEPTLQMKFLTNNSPFAGREGTYVTPRNIEYRLSSDLHTY